MAVFDNFPYTNFHDLNLDEFFAAFKKLQDEWDSFGYTVTASAHEGSTISVTTTGDLINGLNFDFSLVKGPEGPEGPTGNGILSVTFNPVDYSLTFNFTDGDSFTTPSLRGETGAGLKILGVYSTVTELRNAHPTGSAGDMYQVGTSPNFTLYVWSVDNSNWVAAGTLSSPSASTMTPLMDSNTGAVGTNTTYARADHQHPSDITKADAAVLEEVIEEVNTHEADIENMGINIINNTNAINDLTTALDTKQPILTSGSNIKTINDNSVLGSGNIALNNLLGVDVLSIDTTIANNVTSAVTKEFTNEGGDGYALITVSLTENSSSAVSGRGNIINIQKRSNGITTSYGRAYSRIDTTSSVTLSGVATAWMPLSSADTISVNVQDNGTVVKRLFINILSIGEVSLAEL